MGGKDLHTTRLEISSFSDRSIITSSSRIIEGGMMIDTGEYQGNGDKHIENRVIEETILFLLWGRSTNLNIIMNQLVLLWPLQYGTESAKCNVPRYVGVLAKKAKSKINQNHEQVQ